MTKASSCALALLVLVAIAAAGAGAVRAAEPELGATIEAVLYFDEDVELTVWNRSTVPAIFTFIPSGGWAVDVDHMTLAPDEQSSVTVTEVGVDGAELAVRIGAEASPAPGQQRGEILLVARLYTERPPDYALIIGTAALALLGVLVVVGRHVLRRH